MVGLGALSLAMTLVLAPDAKRPAPPDPVAVLPFKNLNDDPGLDWLKVGIAETMVSDLKKSGKARVVERDQIDRALAELALQNAPGSEESTAARVGKLVGARTIVLGSFQRADKDLRINARFVEVETGVILDAAKTTGKLSDVFTLQDEIVDKLLGRAARERPTRKTTAKTVDAYKMYALSLSTSSAAEKVDYLKKSVAIDPDFTYALDDLAALEQRMTDYAQVSAAKLLDQERGLLAKVSDHALADKDRGEAATQLIGIVLGAQRYHTLVAVAGTILEADIPPSGMLNPGDYAAFSRVIALYNLKQWDLALQYGEQYLKEHPGSSYYSAVDNLMRQMIDTRRRRVEARADYEQRISEQQAGYRDKTGAIRPKMEVNYDLAPCAAGGWASYTDDQVLAACRAFVAKYKNDPDPIVQGQVATAQFNVILGLGERGRFDEARPLAEALIKESKTYDTSLKAQLMSWPSD